MATQGKQFTTLGKGVKVHTDDAFMTILVPIDTQTVADAPLSKSGKSRLVGSSGGFTAIPGTAIKLNLVALTEI